MPASANDKAKKSYSFLQKTLNAPISDSVNVLTPNNVTNIPTDTGVSFVIDRVDSSGNKTPALRELMTGVVSGGTISNLQRGEQGTTAQPHLANAVIEFVNSGEMWNDLIDFMLQDHENPNGNHKTLTDTNGNEWLERASVAAAVNHPKVSNAVAGAAPRIDGSGDDALIDLYFGGKGGGVSHAENPEIISDFFYSGGLLTISAGLVGAMSNVIYYIAGKRYKKTGIPNKTYTINKDTYVDIDTNGNITYTEVANGALTGFTLAANSMRVGKAITNGTGLVSFTQFGVDALNYFNYPNNPYGSNGYINWTPTWQNASVGNGVVTAAYQKLGKKVSGYIVFTLGNTSTVGTNPNFSLPVPAHPRYAATARSNFGEATLIDTGVATYLGYLYLGGSTTLATVSAINAAGTYLTEAAITSAVPFTWGNTDIMILKFEYEAA